MALIVLVASGLFDSGNVSATTQWDPAEPVQFASGVLASSNQWVEVRGVDCAAANECVVVGEFKNSGGGYEAFTMVLTGGVSGQARPVVFANGLDINVTSSAYGTLNAVSCPSVGNCTAVGAVVNAAGKTRAFMVTMTNGIWGDALLADIAGDHPTNPNSSLMSVDCATAGNCSATGQFRNTDGNFQALTISQVNGTWGQGQPALFASGHSPHPNFFTYLGAVSCPSVGNCTAVGRFNNTSNNGESFTIDQVNGTWGQGRRAVFASGVQGTNLSDELFSVDCVSAGNCTAVGGFIDINGGYSAFAQSSTNGTWATPHVAEFATGLLPTQLNFRTDGLSEVSCTAAGHCVAVGFFYEGGTNKKPFTMTQTNGTWGQAEPVILGSTAASNPYAELYSVDCFSSGNCVAVGQFMDNNGGRHGFTMTQTNGTWGQPSSIVFSVGGQSNNPEVVSRAVSCASTGYCLVGGYYKDGSDRYQGLVMKSANNTQSQTPNNPTTPPVASPTTTTVANAPTSSPTTTVAPRSLPATGSDITIGWLLTGMVCVLGGAVAVRLRHRLR